MTRTRPAAVATSLALALSGALFLTPQSAEARPPAAAPAAAPADDGGPNTYFSSPHGFLDDRETSRPVHAKRPKPPPTKGTITGQVVGPGGTPIPRALVTGIRFSDLAQDVGPSQEKAVLARTNGAGQFTLKQLREPYLIRVCSESHRSGLCDQESSKRFSPAWLGPDGNLPSWMRHTRMFQPLAHRSTGRIVVQPTAVVTGTWKGDGALRTLYLTRIDGSIAAQTATDAKGRYRFEVAPGPYRLEADRDEGLRTDSTVPGYRSKRLLLRAGRTVHDNFRTRHAGIVRGLVSSGGVPLANQFVTILDHTGAFAAGVVTNEIGRYVVTSLKPGAYTVTTSYADSAYVPKSQIVAVAQKTVATADLPLDAGRSVSFSTSDVVFPGGNGVVDAELRNADGRVVKTYLGNPAAEVGAQVTFTGLPAAAYTLYVRRVFTPSTPEQVDFPWAQRAVDLTAANQNLGPIALDQPTINLSGTLPKGGRLKLTAVPEDAWLRPSYVDGGQATLMGLNWTGAQEAGGQYVVRGLVPGTYTAVVTSGIRARDGKPSKTRGNLAATHSTVILGAVSATQGFTAPEGAKVRGELRYDGSNRPVIAPFGYQVLDTGDQSWLFPTLSGKQKLGRPFTVERLHAGPALGRLLDLAGLNEEHPGVLIPDDLVSSALNDPGTPFWFTAKRKRLTLVAGQTENIGVVRLKIHGVNGVRAVIGGGGRVG